MNAEENVYRVRAVIFFDRGWWIAQCLECCLCTSSKRREDLPRLLMSQLQGQIAVDILHGKRPFETLPEAPERFWRLYEQGTPVQFVLQEHWFVRWIRRIRGTSEPRPEITLAVA